MLTTSGHRLETTFGLKHKRIYERRKDMCHNLQKPQTLQHEAVDLPRSVQRCLSAGERSVRQEEVRMLEPQL